jgi:cell division protein FtsZ
MNTPSPIWAAAPAAAHPVSMTATAEKIEPVAYEMPAEPEFIAAPVMDAAPELVEAAYEEPAAPLVAQPPAAPAFQHQIDRSESFIPPRPMDALSRQAPQAVQPPMPQAPAPVEKKRSYSLFERVTGAARRAESASIPAPAPQQRAIPTLGTAMPTRSSITESNIAPAGQPRLGIDAPARPKVSTPEDDLLEIPAFLRRQAN